MRRFDCKCIDASLDIKEQKAFLFNKDSCMKVKEPKDAVRRQDENSLLALHCLTTGHAFDWDIASVIGKGTTKHTRDFIEACNTSSTCVNICVTLDPGYRVLRNYWRRRRQAHPPISKSILTPARRATPPPPVSNVYVYMTSAQPPVFTLFDISTLLVVQPPPNNSCNNSEPQTPNLPPLFIIFYCFDKPDPSPIYNIHNLSLCPLNYTRNSLHCHLRKCSIYRVEHL